ncbi:extracellular serine proteinase-like [Lytechinus pictus]|uniref:extracellular serine proteinase-like n=1 Tax=Lytechinus pictus TaxID=7653 RepID=UPI00240D2EDB|nr:extracellular serine proteinase-like [Lytechinus pictus]
MRTFIVLLLAVAASARLAPLLTQRNRIPGRYIVKLKSGEKAEDMISTLSGVNVLYKYKTVFSGFAAQLSDRMVQKLRESPAVEYIEEDGVVFANSVESWGLDRVDQLSLPLDDVYTPIGDGNGVDVYVIDTGINEGHVDFGGRAFIGYDALGGSGDDCNGHGTHCSGTVAGTLYGVAKASNVYGVRVLGCLGSGSWAGVVDGCEWVADNHDGPSVASMSLGGGSSQIVDDAVQYMVDAGITVAVAAGNDNSDACNTSPARSATAITVGATDSTDTRATFSNYGPCVDIFAPGVAITSTWIRSDDAINTISGTSMACPHVAGAAAIMIGMDPNMSPSEVKDAMQLKSIADAVIDPRTGSPNLLLYVGEGSGGGFIPEPYVPVGCGGYFNVSGGSFASPNYPDQYDDGSNCDFIFKAPEGEVVIVTFNDFDLEDGAGCQYDVLQIYDGPSASATLLGEYCGTDSPGIVSSSGKDMFIRFTSDSSITRTGFSAVYRFGIPPSPPETGDCGHTFTGKNGLFSSPNYPSNYGNNEDCGFLIQGEVGEVVSLAFDDFELEQHTTCGYDSVDVHDGDMNGPILDKLCGLNLPGVVTSTQSSMYVRFTSDSSVTRRGFSATYAIL